MQKKDKYLESWGKIFNFLTEDIDSMFVFSEIDNRKCSYKQPKILISKQNIKFKKRKVLYPHTTVQNQHYHRNMYNRIPSNKRLRKHYNNKVCEQLLPKNRKV